MQAQKQLLNRVHDAAVFKRRVRVLSHLLAEELNAGATVLDVGCGDGTIATAIMALRPGLKFEGVDVMLRPTVAIPAKAYDGVTMPFELKSFDWVTIVDVLHHTDDPAVVLRECGRVARLGVVIKDHLREGIGAESTLRLMDWVGNRGHDVRLPYNYLSRQEWDATLAEAGLRPVTWRQKLSLYPKPFDLAFDRDLHFIATVSSIKH